MNFRKADQNSSHSFQLPSPSGASLPDSLSVGVSHGFVSGRLNPVRVPIYSCRSASS